MTSNKKKYSLRTDYLMTAINGIAVLLGVFFLNGLIARVYGLEVLGEFLLIRRTGFAIVGVILLGMNIGIPSLIGRESNMGVERSAIALFIIYTLPFIAIISFIISQGNLFGFNHENALSYGLFILAVSFQYIVYGMYRGHLKMIGANSLQFIGTALIPILVFTFVGDLPRSLSIISGIIIVVNIIYFLVLSSRMTLFAVNVSSITKLARFGFERLISFFSQFVLLAGAPLLISFYSPYTDIAYFNSLISLVRLFLFVIGPLGIVLLPRIAKAVKENNEVQIARGLNILLKLIILYSGLATIYIYSFAGKILELWLGTISESGLWMAPIMVLVIPFYLIIEILRSPIDGLSLRGYNSIVYSIAASILLISFYFLTFLGVNEMQAGVYSFLLGYVSAAIASIVVVKILTNIALPDFRYIVMTLLSFIILHGVMVIINNSHFSFSYQITLKTVSFIALLGALFYQSKNLILELNSIAKEI
jgi:O-antigen/teichoic acid export membrane protein